MVIFQIIFSNMVILDMVIFSDIRKYGNMPYGNVFRNYYHISTSKYGKKKPMIYPEPRREAVAAYFPHPQLEWI